MITLRVRFSGLCLFYKKNQEVKARVLNSGGHVAQLWIDTASGGNGTTRQPDHSDVDECVLDRVSNGQLKGLRRTVDKYVLVGEDLAVANANGPAPGGLPGVAQLRLLHPGLGPVVSKSYGAELTIDHGVFRLGLKRSVQWQDTHPHGRQLSPIPLWVDLLVETSDQVFRIDSSAAVGGWELKPTNQQIDVWLMADGLGASGTHFKHLFDHCGSPMFKPWPSLVKSLPSCPDGDRVTTFKVGNTFCPDGQY